jgi:hypothetical protein
MDCVLRQFPPGQTKNFPPCDGDGGLDGSIKLIINPLHTRCLPVLPSYPITCTLLPSQRYHRNYASVAISSITSSYRLIAACCSAHSPYT